MAISTVYQSKWKPIVEPRRAKPKTYRQAPTHWLKFYEEAVIESEARTAVVQLKSSVFNCFSFYSAKYQKGNVYVSFNWRSAFIVLFLFCLMSERRCVIFV